MRTRAASVALWLGLAWLSTGASMGGTQLSPSVWDGVYTEAQAERGRKAFVASCGGCHRDDMSGGDDSEPPLRGPNFTAKWDRAPLAELYDFIAVNMPRSRPGSLPLETCVDIVAFMLKMNEMPAGASELTTDIDALARIQFRASRPAGR